MSPCAHEHICALVIPTNVWVLQTSSNNEACARWSYHRAIRNDASDSTPQLEDITIEGKVWEELLTWFRHEVICQQRLNLLARWRSPTYICVTAKVESDTWGSWSIKSETSDESRGITRPTRCQHWATTASASSLSLVASPHPTPPVSVGRLRLPLFGDATRVTAVARCRRPDAPPSSRLYCPLDDSRPPYSPLLL